MELEYGLKMLLVYGFACVVALGCTACSGPFGIAVGKDAIQAKVRIAELEVGSAMDSHSAGDKARLEGAIARGRY